MTVLNKIIKRLMSRANSLGAAGLTDQEKEVQELIEEIESHLPAEQQQIRDAYEAGERRKAWIYHGGGQPPAPPDLETYIQSLNQ